VAERLIDLEPIKDRSDRVLPGRSRDLAEADRDRRALLAEVERLRAQVADVRALADEWRDSDHTMYMDDAADEIDVVLGGRS
jgi:hypothetical protein